MNDCCTTGFSWNGTPTGHEGKLAKNEAYIAGDNERRAVLMVHDAIGWKFNNTRLLADHYAKEIGATVYMPNFFDEPVNWKDVSIKVNDNNEAVMERNEDFDWAGWFQRNGPDVRLPEILACAQALKDKYKHVAAVGFCWGGLVNFQLASHAELFDSVTICHPGTPTEEQVRAISTPVHIIAPEHDPTFPQEWKDFCNKEIPKLGVDYCYQHFPRVVHGFTTKCDENNKDERKALELAKNSVVHWIANHTK